MEVECKFAVISDHHVTGVVRTSSYDVVSRTGNHEVTAVTGDDEISATSFRCGRFQLAQDVFAITGQRVEVGEAVVAEDDVVAAARTILSSPWPPAMISFPPPV